MKVIIQLLIIISCVIHGQTGSAHRIEKSVNRSKTVKQTESRKVSQTSKAAVPEKKIIKQAVFEQTDLNEKIDTKVNEILSKTSVYKLLLTKINDDGVKDTIIGSVTISKNKIEMALPDNIITFVKNNDISSFSKYEGQIYTLALIFILAGAFYFFVKKKLAVIEGRLTVCEDNFEIADENFKNQRGELNKISNVFQNKLNAIVDLQTLASKESRFQIMEGGLTECENDIHRLKTITNTTEDRSTETDSFHDVFMHEPKLSPTRSSIEKNKNNSTSVFYFGRPSKDGYFSDKDKYTEYKGDVTYYQVTLKHPNYGSFSPVFDEYSIKDALNAPDVYLDPACKILNSKSPNTRRIAIGKKGVVIKNGDKWKIQDKAEIRYE